MLDDLSVPAARQLSTVAVATHRTVIEAALRRSRRPLWRRPVSLLGGGAAVVLTLGAGAAYVATAPESQPSVIHCYSLPGMSSGDLATDTNHLAGNSAVDACAGLWHVGVIRPGMPAQREGYPTPTEYAVPPLVACVAKDGSAAVFPGDAQLCVKLGLPTLKS